MVETKIYGGCTVRIDSDQIKDAICNKPAKYALICPKCKRIREYYCDTLHSPPSIMPTCRLNVTCCMTCGQIVSSNSHRVECGHSRSLWTTWCVADEHIIRKILDMSIHTCFQMLNFCQNSANSNSYRISNKNHNNSKWLEATSFEPFFVDAYKCVNYDYSLKISKFFLTIVMTSYIILMYKR